MIMFNEKHLLFIHGYILILTHHPLSDLAGSRHNTPQCT